MIRLFIENKYEAELGDNFNVPLTKAFENLENPTQILNTYSKTVTIPHTQKNDRLFGFLFNPDRLTAKESTPLVGIYFDPYQKISMRLEWNDSVLLTGYLKVLSVDSKGYNCSLNGELGKVFQELKKITFDDTKYEGEDKTKYWIDGSQYVSEKITKDLVKFCWDSNGQSSLKLFKKGERGYRVSDIIGFTPNTSYNKDFTYSNVWTKSDLRMHSFEDVLKGRKWDDNTSWENKVGVTANSVVSNGIKPMAYQNFVSYNQNPFIWWNKFWNIFKEKAEAVTGYKWDMNDAFFDDSNQFWSKSAIELMNRDEFAESKFLQIPALKITTNDITTKSAIFKNEANLITPVTTISPANVWDNTSDDTQFVVNANLTTVFVPKFSTADSKEVTVSLWYYKDILTNTEYYSYLEFTLTFNTDNGDVTSSWFFVDNSMVETFRASNPTANIIGVGSSSKISTGTAGDTINFVVSTQLNMVVPGKINSYNAFWTKHCSGFPNGDGFENLFSWDSKTTVVEDKNALVVKGTIIDMSSYNQILYNRFRSNDKFTLNTLCNLDFTSILNYCKQFRILITADDINKKLIFRQQADYFKNYTISNWDNKLDKTKDFIITPVTWNKKYILFAYKDHPAELGETYKNSNGFTYGEKRIITRYNFNEETNELFKSWYSPLLFSPTYNYWNELYRDFSAYPYVYANKFLCCEDKDGKYKAISGTWFIPAFTNIDCPDRDTVIADDIDQMVAANSYCYTDINTVSITKWCTPEVKFGDMLFLFNKPNISYVYKNDYYNNCKGLYDLFWAKYIAERYNTQNKIVTCYLKLTPSDYANFDFNHFITIENQLYMVNKIYDYDITNDESTKVDLITIQDIKGYTTNNYGTDKNHQH